MTDTPFTIEAIYEDGVLRPTTPVDLMPHQRVTITVDIKQHARRWPEDVAAIYRELEEDDRRLANEMFGWLRESWPRSEPAS